MGNLDFGLETCINMRYLLFLFAIAFFSCQAPAPPESREDKMAKSLCGCTTHLLALNQQAASVPDSLAFRNIAQEFEKALACATNLGIKPTDSISLKLSLKTHCPALAEHTDLLSELLGQ